MGFLDSEGLAYFWEKVKPGLGGTGGGGGVPKGSIITWSGSASDIPEGWALCDGAEYEIATYPALAEFFRQQFGTKNYFGGNGTDTFAVPDLRDRFVLGGGGTHTVGETGGEETHKLTVAEIPSHSHYLGFGLANTGLGPNSSYQSVKAQSDTTGYTGGNTAHNNMPPYYTLCYIIKVTDGGSGSAEEVYSTEETRIGTWIDKKPLYAKTYVLNVRCPGAAETAIVDHDLPPIQTLVKSKGIAVFGTIQSPYPSNRVATYYLPDSNAIFASNSNSVGNAATIKSCTIEYTKTTDQPED